MSELLESGFQPLMPLHLVQNTGILAVSLWFWGFFTQSIEHQENFLIFQISFIFDSTFLQ